MHNLICLHLMVRLTDAGQASTTQIRFIYGIEGGDQAYSM